MLPEPPEYPQFLAPYPAAVSDLARSARKRLLVILWPVSEIVYDAISAVSVGFSYTGEVRDHFINLPVYFKHVNLGFVWGINLDDPEGRLLGDGSQYRHLRLDGLEMLEDRYVLRLLRQAAEQAPKPEKPMAPQTVIRVMKGVKRRPNST